ncbi:MAG: hypothetical protein IJ153_04690 [Clostridia bacterium]|nr:hypothetical protein [Clostridia bacterium]
MVDTGRIVQIPESAIVCKDGKVYWTVEKRYLKSRRYNVDLRKLIGRRIEDSAGEMFPNDNFQRLFPETFEHARRVEPQRRKDGRKTIAEQFREQQEG